jgi:phosphoglycolate phosphatase/putative hydrolase of the HAD superfamily
VGDRYDIDIALPLQLGMGGVLVDGVSDVYGLPPVLTGKKPAGDFQNIITGV